MSETTTETPETQNPNPVNRFTESFRRATRTDLVTCLNCGAVNQAGEVKCENCGEPLQQPANLYVNIAQTLVLPQKAMPRIAATSPVLQAFLVVILMAAITTLLSVFATLVVFQELLNDQTKFNQDFAATITTQPPEERLTQLFYYFRAPAEERADPAKFNASYATWLDQNKITPEKRLQNYNDFTSNPPLPGALFLVSQILYLLISWVFFALAIYYAVKLVFRNAAPRTSMVSLLSVVGFARITTIGALVFLLPQGPAELQAVLQILLIVWKIALITVGVKYSTGLAWTRSAIIVVALALVFQLFLKIPI